MTINNKSTNVFNRKVSTAALAISAIVLTSTTSSAQSLDALSDYSVITSGDFESSAEVEGKALIGGNLKGSSSVNFGVLLQNITPRDEIVLRVAGDIESGGDINLSAGSLELGGSISRRVNYNGQGSLVSTPGLDVSSIFNELNQASSQLSNMSANSTITFPGNQASNLIFNANPNSDGLSVFSTNASAIFSNPNVQELVIQTPSGNPGDIVINVAGINIDFTDGNFNSSFQADAFESTVVWNFFEAETLDLGSISFSGQILAPNAHLTAAGVINGSIYVASLDISSEVHLPTYKGNIPLVPEPSSTLLLGLGALGMMMRRKKA